MSLYTRFFKPLHPALLILLQVGDQGRFRNTTEPTNFLMFQPLTFEIDSLHLFLNFGIRMLIALPFKRVNFFGCKFDFDHGEPHSDWTSNPDIPEFSQQ